MRFLTLMISYQQRIGSQSRAWELGTAWLSILRLQSSQLHAESISTSHIPPVTPREGVWTPTTSACLFTTPCAKLVSYTTAAARARTRVQLRSFSYLLLTSFPAFLWLPALPCGERREYRYSYYWQYMCVLSDGLVHCTSYIVHQIII